MQLNINHYYAVKYKSLYAINYYCKCIFLYNSYSAILEYIDGIKTPKKVRSNSKQQFCR